MDGLQRLLASRSIPSASAPHDDDDARRRTNTDGGQPRPQSASPVASPTAASRGASREASRGALRWYSPASSVPARGARIRRGTRRPGHPRAGSGCSSMGRLRSRRLRGRSGRPARPRTRIGGGRTPHARRRWRRTATEARGFASRTPTRSPSCCPARLIHAPSTACCSLWISTGSSTWSSRSAERARRALCSRDASSIPTSARR